MHTKLSGNHLLQLSTLVADTMGLDFPQLRWPDLERGIIAAARGLGIEQDIADWTQSILSTGLSKDVTAELAVHLTVGETYFLRESQYCAAFVTHILPAILKARPPGEKRLRIWSAACCTGEEPYSIAILLRQSIPDIDQWNITILATDINAHSLNQAQQGVFGPWSFRNTPSWFKERYFGATPDGRYEIAPQIKNMVCFAAQNLVSDVYPCPATETQDMDIIFCRNVLMYFTPAQAQNVIHRFHRASADGWLIVGSSELLHVSNSLYTTIPALGVMLYQRRPDAQQASEQLKSTMLSLAEPARDPLSLKDSLPVPSTITIPASLSMNSVVEGPARTLSPCTVAQAVELWERGDYPQAVAICHSVLLHAPETPLALCLLAHCLADMGRLAEALVRCDQWIVADKLNPSSHYLRGTILQEQNKTEEAILSFRSALYLDPRFTLAHFSLGTMARHRGNAREASRHFRNTRELLHTSATDDPAQNFSGLTAGRLDKIVDELMNSETMA